MSPAAEALLAEPGNDDVGCRNRFGVPDGLVAAITQAAAAAHARLGIPLKARGNDWEEEFVVTARGLAQLGWLKARALDDPELTSERAAELLGDEEFVKILEPILEETRGALPPDDVLVALHYDTLIADYRRRHRKARLRVLMQRRAAISTPARPSVVVLGDRARPRARASRSRRRASRASPGRPDDDPEPEPEPVARPAGGRLGVEARP